MAQTLPAIGGARFRSEQFPDLPGIDPATRAIQADRAVMDLQRVPPAEQLAQPVHRSLEGIVCCVGFRVRP